MITQAHHYRPELHKDSSCGSVVLAALLGMSTQEADMWMDLYAPKGWKGYTNVSHIRAVCEKNGIKMNKLKTIPKGLGIPVSHTTQPTALFIQMRGPWEKKGWRSSYSHTHWALMHHHHVMDINNRYSLDEDPYWFDVDSWKNEAMATLANSIEGCTGFKLKAMYEFIEVPK